jgi:HAE1 family hydrophobic/amphiphilic exporter-1
MTTLLTIAIFCGGIVGLLLLPQSNMPNVDFPTIMVSASLPGANPDTMAASVATPLEKRFSTIDGIDSMSSSSTPGRTQITLQFDLKKNIETAAQDVQSAISQASRSLPQAMPAPPSYRKMNPAAQPIFLFALTSDTVPLSQLDYYASTYLSPRLSMVSGVAQVETFGSRKYAVRIRIDPNALAGRGIGIDEISSAIGSGNVNLPTGTLDGTSRSFTVQSSGQLIDAESYKNLIVAWRGGAPIRLGDIASVEDSIENLKSISWFNGKPSITLAVQRQPGTNTVAVVDRIRKVLPTMQKQLPASVHLEVFRDMSKSIRQSVEDVQITLLIAIILVIGVIFLFLRNVSATIIPGIALILSIIGTFAVMYFLKFSLDILSLMAITLSVGFVVDDAIVMLENIVRHVEKKEKPYQASLIGSQEIGFTIVSMTLSLVVVFIPVLFMQGVIGRLLNEFAVTISVAILLSGFISLSLTPMMCSRFLKPPDHSKTNPFFSMLERLFQHLQKGYERTLTIAIRRNKATLATAAVILILTGVLFAKIQKGFIPNDDVDTLTGNTEAAQGIPFDAMVSHQQAVAEIIANDPHTESLMSSVYSTGNTGNFFIGLIPAKKRKLNADQIVESFRPKLAKIPGIKTFIMNPPVIPIGTRRSKSPYQFTLQNPDTARLYEEAERFEAKMQNLPVLQDVSSDLQLNNPQIQVEIDRDKASSLGITPFRIEDALYSAYGSRNVSTIFTTDNDYSVILELDPKFTKDPSALEMLYIRSERGALIPLSTVARITETIGPNAINHQGQLPSVTLSFGIQPGASLGEATDAVKKLASAELPADITTSFQGSAQVFQDSMRGLAPLFLAAILVIYIVLGILYEDFFHPITILSGLPSAAFGALLTLILFRKQLDLYAIVGILMLIGIVKKNAIMMIDFAIERMHNQKMDAKEAIFQGSLIRFRPILMTSVCAFMGALPIAIGVGAGAISRRPLGLAVTGGLLFSQVFTLYLTPVFFLLVEDSKKIFTRSKRKQSSSIQP